MGFDSVVIANSSGPQSTVDANLIIEKIGEQIPFRVDVVEGGWRTSTGETLFCGADGIIDTVRFSTPDFVSRRVEKKIPRWRIPLSALRQGYNPPTDIDIEDTCIVDNGEEYEATIARPYQPQSCTGVALFIGGTGIFDRHGFTPTFDIGTHQLLDGLAREGIATVRFERMSRRMGHLPAGEEGLDFQAIAKGAARWLDWLGGQPWATGKPIVIVVHSLGGLVALYLSTIRKDLVIIVTLNTPARPLTDVTDEQHAWFGAHLDLSDEAFSEREKFRKEFVRALELDEPWTEDNVPARLLPMKRQRALFKSVWNRPLCVRPQRSVSTNRRQGGARYSSVTK